MSSSGKQKLPSRCMRLLLCTWYVIPCHQVCHHRQINTKHQTIKSLFVLVCTTEKTAKKEQSFIFNHVIRSKRKDKVHDARRMTAVFSTLKITVVVQMNGSNMCINVCSLISFCWLSTATFLFDWCCVNALVFIVWLSCSPTPPDFFLIKLCTERNKQGYTGLLQ